MGFTGAMAVAMMVEAVLGWPNGLFARVGHPVTWLGRLIKILDISFNRTIDPPAVRRIAGAAVALFVIGLSAGIGWAVQVALAFEWGRIVLLGILAWPLVALRSLYMWPLLLTPCNPVIS